MQRKALLRLWYFLLEISSTYKDVRSLPELMCSSRIHLSALTDSLSLHETVFKLAT